MRVSHVNIWACLTRQPPHLSAILSAPGRMYRTGDLVYRRAQGEMVFVWVAKISRVKLRGFRIELSDVQANVVEASRELGRKVDACLCVVREDQLIAFVATEDPTFSYGPAIC